MSSTLNLGTTFHRDTCITCAVQFYLPEGVYWQRRRDGESYNCPNGHRQRFSETEEARLRKQLEGVARDRDDYLARLESARKTIINLRGQLTRAKRAAGRRDTRRRS